MNILKTTYTIGGVDFDTRLLLIIVLTTILPMLDWYKHMPSAWLLNQLGINTNGLDLLTLKALDRFIYYFIIPMLVITLLWWENPRDYGFQLGNWREGIAWTLFAILGMSLILWFIARSEGMSSYYATRSLSDPFRLIAVTGLDLFSWEFIWRGFMLFGIAKVLGPGPAIMIQAIPFAFMHLNKPEIETLSTIFGGIAFGFIAWRTDSFAYPFLIHWYIASFTQLIARGWF
jgi:uncharacterized protein